MTACSDDPAGPAELEDGLASARADLGLEAVRDFNALAPWLAGALGAGPRGCAWEFDVGEPGYLASVCGEMSHDSAVAYAVPDPPPAPGSATLPFALPLVPRGFVVVGGGDCPDGFIHAHPGGNRLLACGAATPNDPNAWSAVLRGDLAWVITTRRVPANDPEPAIRYDVRLAVLDVDIQLVMTLPVNQERVTHHLEADRNGQLLVLDGESTPAGPDYTATLDNQPLGLISWSATTGLILTDPAGQPLPSGDEQLLRDAYEVMAGLGVVAGNVSLLLGET